MSDRRQVMLGVIGESDCSPELYSAAEEVGRLAAERGAAVVCGGLGGVMEAACRGCRSAGGPTFGFLPGQSKREANPFVTYALPTGMGEARNVLVVLASDVLVAVGGKYGTLSEMALALKIGRPLVGLNTWGLTQGGQRVTPFRTADSPAEAVDLAFQLILGT